MSNARMVCSRLIRILVLWSVIASANLAALYVAAGVAFRGDWDRVDSAVTEAYDGIFKD